MMRLVFLNKLLISALKLIARAVHFSFEKNKCCHVITRHEKKIPSFFVTLKHDEVYRRKSKFYKINKKHISY